jgi:hypothetical protein
MQLIRPWFTLCLPRRAVGSGSSGTAAQARLSVRIKSDNREGCIVNFGGVCVAAKRAISCGKIAPVVMIKSYQDTQQNNIAACAMAVERQVHHHVLQSAAAEDAFAST